MNTHSPIRLLLDSLKLSFLHITPYHLDYTWQIRSTRIQHAILWYVVEGEFSFTVNGTQFNANTGQLIFLPPHSDISSHAVTTQVGIISINFDAELSLLKGQSWSAIFKLPVVYASYEMSILEPIIHMMLRESQESSFAQSMLLQSSLERLMALIFNQYYKTQSNSEGMPSLDPRVQAVIEYLSLHPESTPELNELCDIVRVSPSYLRKLFIESTGLSPIAFMQHNKIEQAQKRLLEGTERVSEIAFQLGFQDANYFSRLFKKKTGYTPNDYRQQLRNWMN